MELQTLGEPLLSVKSHKSDPLFLWVWKLVRTEEMTPPPNSLKPENLNLPEILSRHGVIASIFISQKWYLLVSLFLKLISSFLSFTGPVFIRLLIDYISQEEKPLSYGLLLFSIYTLCNFVSMICGTNGGFIEAKVQNRVRTGLNSVLYEKIIKTTNIPEGTGVNIMQVDARKVYEFFSYATGLICMPTELALAIYFIYAEVGVAVFAGIAILLSVFGINLLMSRKIKKINEELLKLKDQRMAISKQVFGEIRGIKSQGWESIFKERIFEVRNLEVKQMKWLYFVWSVNIFILWTSPVLTTITIFLVYTEALGNTLTASKAFVTLSALFLLQDPIRELPFAITKIIQAYISVKRIQSILDLPDLPKLDYSDITEINNCNFYYGEQKVLSEIDLQLVPGEFLAVVGPVGSGKSSLLNALMGEMRSEGQFTSHSDRSYAGSMDGWLINDTIRNNILMGNDFAHDWYWSVVSSCALIPDFESLPGKDMTEIGEKGINLSGGQKARINLARAVYANKPLILMDDPLSSVDTHVAAHIFNECFCKLLSGKTRVLVTHRLEFITKVDRVIVLENGRIKEVTQDCSYIPAGIPTQPISLDSENVEALLQEEEREMGRVSRSVYLSYFKYSGNILPLVCALIVMLMWTGSLVTGDIYLKNWSQDDSETQMLFYCCIKLGGCVFIFLRSLLVLNVIGVRSSKKIHEKLINSLLSAPINLFYDITPTGRVINRLSKDQNEIDDEVALGMGAILARIFSALATLIIQLIYFPYILLSIPLLIYISTRISNLYIACAREFRRIESISYSNLMQKLGECMAGAKVIRCFQKQEFFIRENFKALEENVKVSYNLISLGGWQVLYLGFVSALFCSIMFALMLALRYSISAGELGLCMSYSILLPGLVMYTIFTFLNVEKNMIAVERAIAYIKVPQERENRFLSNDKSFIEEGSVEFCNFSLRYRPDTPVILKEISFRISPGEKIGIVGRTGSGKSSIFLAMLRIGEANTGKILISNTDVSTVSLETLRKAITFIPQDPILFEGTLRDNLSISGSLDDEKIEDILKRIGLDHIDLGFEVKGKGLNLSVGERQLLNIGRALYSDNKLLLLDEATAGLDPETDLHIQSLINSHFKGRTLMIIAHRLQTILDSHKVLVLNNGSLVEADSPQNLLLWNSYFKALLENA